jgi:hypothetical protein
MSTAMKRFPAISETSWGCTPTWVAMDITPSEYVPCDADASPCSRKARLVISAFFSAFSASISSARARKSFARWAISASAAGAGVGAGMAVTRLFFRDSFRTVSSGDSSISERLESLRSGGAVAARDCFPRAWTFELAFGGAPAFLLIVPGRGVLERVLCAGSVLI